MRDAGPSEAPWAKDEARRVRPCPGLAHRPSPLATLLVLAALLGGSAPVGRADSLWTDGVSRPMVSDKRAVGLGDILHIVVQENNSTTKNNTTTTKKGSSMDAKIASFLYSPAASGLLTKGGQMPALKAESSYGFNGGGKIDNSERVVARVAVVVVDVLPNGNLIIEGRRQTAYAGETQEILLRGVVRPADIQPNNTVFSYHVADASIRFVSKGTVTDSQRKGWFARLWEKVTPF